MPPNHEKAEGLFRQESLERLSSPERLDQLMQVVNPLDWLMLATFGSLVLAGLAWSVMGRIPVTVEGRGVLMQPRQIMDFQSAIAGQLTEVKVRGGQCVQKGDILATIDPLDLRQQLRLAQGKLGQLRTQTQDSRMLTSRRTQTERSAIEASRASLRQRLRDTQALAPVLRDKGLGAVQEQRRSLEQRLANARSLVPVRRKRVEDLRNLQAQGAINRDYLLQIEQAYIQSKETVAEIEAQLKALDVESTEAERRYLENLRSTGELQAQLQELEARDTRLNQETLDTNTLRDRELQDVNREITRLNQQINNNSQVISPQAGCLIEVNAQPGQVVQPGTKLGYLQTINQGDTMRGMGYLAIKDGKRVKAGMKIIVIPDTVQRERFGGILGEVTQVSALPVTKEGALAAIGNADLVQGLLAGNSAVIGVEAKLRADSQTDSGYQWSSSRGPSEMITPGTTVTVRITIEERAPITFLLPFLQEFGSDRKPKLAMNVPLDRLQTSHLGFESQ